MQYYRNGILVCTQNDVMGESKETKMITKKIYISGLSTFLEFVKFALKLNFTTPPHSSFCHAMTD